MYNNLSKQGFNPGQEFVVDVREGQRIGADIVLGDQDMGVTMQCLALASQMTDFRKLSDPTNSRFQQSMKKLNQNKVKKIIHECSNML
jgi:pheromone shutdown protein TraB